MTRDAVRFREGIEVDESRSPIPARDGGGLEEIMRGSSGDEISVGLVYDESNVMFVGKLSELCQKRGRIYTASLDGLVSIGTSHGGERTGLFGVTRTIALVFEVISDSHASGDGMKSSSGRVGRRTVLMFSVVSVILDEQFVNLSYQIE